MAKNQRSEAEPNLITVSATPAQVEELARLGVLSSEQVAAGRAAGGLAVQLPAKLAEEWLDQERQLTELAERIHKAGLNGPARLFLAAGRPLSFIGSQTLLLVQPLSRLLFGEHDSAGRYSRLLENRANVDRLLARLAQLELTGKEQK